MSDIKIIALCSLLVAAIGVVWRIIHDTKKRPKVVVVTKDKAPASDAELIADDGAQFSISPQTGFAYVPSNYTGTLFIVRHLQTRKELTRFTLKTGLNEVSI